MMIPRFMVAALCVLGPLTAVAHGGNINGEATYISFSVPGALGTYPMSINNSMTVTGYYYVSPTVTRGFLRDADGNITTFSVRDGVWTEPESINTAGDITGFYEDFPAAQSFGVLHGFIRYADGRTVTFNGPASGNAGSQAQPIGINDWGEVVGNFPFPNVAANVFTRSASGSFSDFDLAIGSSYATVATGLNDSGTIIGYVEPGFFGYTFDPKGIVDTFDVPLKLGQDDYVGNEITTPESINADGAIAGWYNAFIQTCLVGCINPTTTAGAFVRSPQGVFTLFNPPGTLVISPKTGLWEESTFASSLSLSAPHRLSINGEGSITGSYVDVAGAQHGFVRNPYGTITSFDPPEGNQTTATSIADGGAIAGYYNYHAGAGPAVGFIRVPQ
jgi:hypothetical protein